MKPAIVIPAAGLSSRMRSPNIHKLLSTLDGETLIRRACVTALQSGADIYVVTGYRSDDLRAALVGLPVRHLYNSCYQNGIGTSLSCAICALTLVGYSAALVHLPDMPNVTSDHLKAMILQHQAHPEAVIRATSMGEVGNPVLLPRSLFPKVLKLDADIGAKPLIAQSDLEVINVEIGPAALTDLDTPEALMAAGGLLELS